MPTDNYESEWQTRKKRIDTPPKRVFTIAHGVEDTVGSMWLVRGADGREYKSEDYLEAFSRFNEAMAA